MNTTQLYCILCVSLLGNLGLGLSLLRSHKKGKFLLFKSRIDELTGILNRFACIDEINRRIKDSKDTGLQALFLIDLDNFKQINDTYGHRTGDDVLRFLSKRMREEFDEHAILGRWGGDEFLIFLSGIREYEEVEQAAVRLNRLITGEIPGVPERISISIGIVIAKPGEDFSRLMQRADQALYYVKNHGKNSFRLDL